MTLAVQQSLFEPGGGEPMLAAARWIESVMLGEVGLVMLVLAVAFVGLMMLTGRLPLYEGGRVVVGCFVLLSVPVIAQGLLSDERPASAAPAPVPAAAEAENLRADLAPAMSRQEQIAPLQP